MMSINRKKCEIELQELSTKTSHVIQRLSLYSGKAASSQQEDPEDGARRQEQMESDGAGGEHHEHQGQETLGYQYPQLYHFTVTGKGILKHVKQ